MVGRALVSDSCKFDSQGYPPSKSFSSLIVGDPLCVAPKPQAFRGCVCPFPLMLRPVVIHDSLME